MIRKTLYYGWIVGLLAAAGQAGLARAQQQQEGHAVGPNGGLIHNIHVAPGSPNVIFAVGRNRLFKSIDAGETWRDVTPAVFGEYRRPTLHLSSTGAEELFLIGPGGKVFHSANAGRTWESYLAESSYRVIFIDPDAPAYLVAYESLGAYENTLLKSTDGGATWETAVEGIDIQGKWVRVWINPHAPDHMVATVWCCGDAITLIEHYATTDAGEHWQRISNEPRLLEEVVFDPSDPQTLYALTREAFYKSTDGGATWVELADPAPESNFRNLAVDPGNPEMLYYTPRARTTLHTQPVYKSEDGGLTWAQVGTVTSAGTPTSIAINPQQPEQLFFGGSAHALYRSDDGGQSWQIKNDGIVVTDVYVLVVRSRDVLFAAVEGLGLMRTLDGGQTWNVVIPNLSSGGLDAIVRAAPASKTIFSNILPTTFYRDDPSWGRTGGLAVSHDEGQSWQYYRGIGGGPRVFDVTSDGMTLYGEASLGTTDGLVRSGFIKSTNGGQTWEEKPLNLPINGIRKIQIDPGNPDVVYALVALRGAVNIDVLLRSTDGGTTWATIAEDVGVFFLNTTNPDRLYYSSADPDYRIYNGIFFISTDRGTTWTPSATRPDSLGLYDLAVHPADPNLLVASTGSKRIVLSRDNGHTWESVVGPVRTPLLTLSFAPDDPSLLFGNTRTASVLRFDLSAHVPTAVAEVPSPRRGFRFTGSYPNPSTARVVLDYELSAPAAVTLQIYDLLGRRLRALVQRRQPAGTHRVIWDGNDEAGRRVPGGLYFCELRIGTRRDVRSILIVQ